MPDVPCAAGFCPKGAEMPGLDHRKTAIRLAIASLAAVAVFVLWPGLDLAVSAAFYREGEGFWLGRLDFVQALRHFIWNLSIAAVLLSLVALGLAAIRRPLPDFGARPAGFIFLLYLLGPVLLVNAVLKNHWGRARPADTTQFGGTLTFTPPWLPSDQCASNCSFVSGEGSAAVALAITFLLLAPLLRRVLPDLLFRAYAVLAVFLPAAGLALRVMTGRHFLSDTVFAVLFVLAIALGLHRWLLTERR